MADARLGILLTADTAQAQSALNAFNKSLDTSTDKLNIVSIGSAKFGLSLTSLQQKVSQFGGGVSKFNSSFDKIPPAINNANSALSKIPNSSNQATLALSNLGRVAQDAPFGFLGIANNLNPLLESFQRLKVSTGSTKGALQALGQSLTGAGGIGFALSVASSLLIVFGDRLFGAGKKAKEAADSAEAFKSAVDGIFEDAAKEATQVSSLIAVLKSETETRERKLGALKELAKIQPEVFNGLKLEGNAVAGLDEAYKLYIVSLRSVITLKIKQLQLEALIKRQLELQGVTLTETQRKSVETLKRINKNLGLDPTKFEFNQKRVAATTSELNDNLKDQQALLQEIGDLSKSVEIPGLKAEAPVKIKVKPEFEIPFNLLQQQLLKSFPEEIPLPPFEFVPDTDALNANFFKELVKDLNTQDTPIEIPVVGLIELELAVKAAKKKEEFEKQIVDNINDILANINLDGVVSIGDALGTALAGGDLSGVFNQFANSLASALQSIGKQLIQIGGLAQLTKKALASLFTNPTLAVAVGIGLVAAGAALRATLSKGIQFRERGGPFSGGLPLVVGEKGPELLFPKTGGTVVPNHNLSSFGGFQNEMKVIVQGIIRGNDIVLSNNRTDRSNRRNG